MEKARKQNIMLTFQKMKDKYALTEVVVDFVLLNSTFVNSTGNYFIVYREIRC